MILLHLLSAKEKRSFISTRWIDSQNNVIYELAFYGKFDGDIVELYPLQEVLYVPPYGSSSIKADLSEAVTVESKTRRGDRLIKIVGGIVYIGEVVIKRRPPVPKLMKEPELDNTTVAT